MATPSPQPAPLLRRALCTGGQGTEPKEQKTQQSPGFGRKSAPQLLQL